MIIEPRLLSVVISLQSVLPGESCKESLLVGEVRSLDFCGAGEQREKDRTTVDQGWVIDACATSKSSTCP